MVENYANQISDYDQLGSLDYSMYICLGDCNTSLLQNCLSDLEFSVNGENITYKTWRLSEYYDGSFNNLAE